MTARGACDGAASERKPGARGASDRSPDGARASDRGSASVLALVLVVVLGIVALAAVTLGGLLSGQRRAAAAADLAALAAAQAATGAVPAVAVAPDPCGEAHRVGSANGARVTGCRVEGLEVTVSVVVAVPVPVAGEVEVPGQARAGPVPSWSAGLSR